MAIFPSEDPGTGGADPGEDSFVVHQHSRSDASGEHDDVGLGELVERRVDGDAEHAVRAAHLAAFVADERDVDRGDPLQHLVRPDGVERSEAGEQWNRYPHGVWLHGVWLHGVSHFFVMGEMG